ncbi:MAG TPA: hypothetical protein PLI51_01225 [bacterium]|nr:hypothetical protein [bacterium]HPQ65334.1 hypothetical protein [bacterium]
MTARPERKLPGLLLLAAAGWGCALILAVPPWQAPDEPTHFVYIRAQRGGGDFDPARLEEEIIRSMDGYRWWELVGARRPAVLPGRFFDAPFLRAAPSQMRKNPRLYYLLASRVLFLPGGASLEGGLYLLRFFSLGLTLLSAAAAWAAVSRVFPERELALGAASAVLVPQYLLIGTSVSVEPAINLCSALFFLELLGTLEAGPTLRRVLGLGAAYALGLMVSYKFLVLLPVVPPALACAGRSRFPGAAWRRAAAGALLAAGIFWGLAAVDPRSLGLAVARLRELYDTVFSWGAASGSLPGGYWNWFNARVFESFWIRYGWSAFPLPPDYYRALRIVCLGALAGLACAWFRDRFRGVSRGIALAAGYALAVTAGFYLFWGPREAETSAQGRHLFMAMPAWGILLAAGLGGLWPERKRLVGAAIFAGMLLLDAAALFGYIIPTFS